MDNTEVVRAFEEEFKNKNNHDIVDTLMTDDLMHNLPFPGMPAGREGMRAVGKVVTGAFRDIHVTIDILFSDGGDLVADRITATAIRNANGEPASCIENHIYRIRDGRIAEIWPAGGPQL